MKATLLVIGLLTTAGFGAMTVAADPNENALFGLCTAWAANENGRENGNAGNAGPFVWLQKQADDNDQTVEEFCGDVEHPRNNGNGGGRP